MSSHDRKLRPGDMVVLTEVPSGLLEGLPIEDQRAISEIVGRPVLLVEYDEDGRAELEFKEGDETFHSIWVDPVFVRAAK